MTNKLRGMAATFFSTLVLTGCGGGGAGGSSTAGIDRLGITSGPVSGFGSVIVNGVTYNTDTAEFRVEESLNAQQSDLRVGDVVVITFDPSQSATTALLVISEAALKGPVQSLNLLANELVVAGQNVRVTPATIIDNGIGGGVLQAITVGSFVEVHGFADAGGGLRATRIDAGAGDVEVSGVVSNLNAVAQTFNIGALLVDFGAVPAEIEGFMGGVLSNGVQVEVEGNLNGAGVLLADEVEANDLPASGVDFDDFDEVEADIDGLINRFVSPSDFDVAGFPVRTNSGTTFENGTAADLSLNVRVEVEGELNQSGVLVADEVEFSEDIDLVVSGQLDQDPSVTSVRVLGIEFTVDSSTLLEDQSSADLDSLQLAQLNTGDYLTIVASEVGSNLVARLIERDDLPGDPGEDAEIIGAVGQIAQTSFMIRGVTVVTNSTTEFENANGNEVSQQVFFSALAPGDVVEADGFESSQTTLLAEEVAIAELDFD